MDYIRFGFCLDYLGRFVGVGRFSARFLACLSAFLYEIVKERTTIRLIFDSPVPTKILLQDDLRAEKNLKERQSLCSYTGIIPEGIIHRYKKPQYRDISCIILPHEVLHPSRVKFNRRPV